MPGLGASQSQLPPFTSCSHRFGLLFRHDPQVSSFSAVRKHTRETSAMAFSTQGPVTFPQSAVFRGSTSEYYATSQFTPPSGCQTRMATTFLDGRSASAQWDFEFGNNATMTCSDPLWVLAQRSYLSSTKTALFNTQSVAGVCPSGYDIVGTAKDYFSNAYFDYKIDGGGKTTTTVAKTQAFCCPR